MSICFLNNKFQDIKDAKISPMDRGFLFGDSIYEVIIAFEKKPFQLDAHLKRLEKNLSTLGYNLKNFLELKEVILDLISRNSFLNQVIYVQISRGIDEIRDHIPNPNLVPTVFISSHELQTDFSLNSGEKAILKKDFRWRKSQIKATSLLANVMFRDESNQKGVFETILYENGYVTEGAVSNIFCCKNDKVFTPSLEENILPGVTRKVILELLEENSISYEEDKISLDFFSSSDEIWVTNSTKGIIPIVDLDGKEIGSGLPGKIYSKIAKSFKIRISN